MNKDLQPSNTYGKEIKIKDFVDMQCVQSYPTITALRNKELGELTLLGFDVEPTMYEGTGKIEMSMYGPILKMPKMDIKEKNIYTTFSKVEMTNNTVTVHEFGGQAGQYVAVAEALNTNVVEFDTVSGLTVNDTVLIVAATKDSSAVEAKVKITDVDTVTNEITFNTNVTIGEGDYIRFITSDQGGCMDNTKGIADIDEGTGRTFNYHTQFISREVEVKLEDLNGSFCAGTKQYERFVNKYFNIPAFEMYKEAANQLRHGSGVGGNMAKIKGYDTIIEEREANGLESIIDFSANTTASEYQKQLEDILTRVNNSPVESKFILLGNHTFHRSYKDMMRELYDEAEARACCILKESIHYGIMKWEVEDAPMVEHYLSEALSMEKPNTGVAYILPVDMIVGFTTNLIEAQLNPNGQLNTTDNTFGTIRTRHKYQKDTAECKFYEHYMRLGFFYAGVSFIDTYFKLTNFDFKR